MKIKNFAEGTEKLIDKLNAYVEFDLTWQVVALGDISIPIAARIAQELSISAIVVNVSRRKDINGFLTEPEVSIPVNIGNKLLVCDIGVETGKTATQFATELKKRSHEFELWLAALVIPKEIEPILKLNYQKLTSIRTPLIRRGLRWEFDEFA